MIPEPRPKCLINEFKRKEKRKEKKENTKNRETLFKSYLTNCLIKWEKKVHILFLCLRLKSILQPGELTRVELLQDDKNLREVNALRFQQLNK